MTIIGIDCGSTACKGVVLEKGQLLSHEIIPTGWNPSESAEKVYRLLLASLTGKTPQDIKVVSTGYGRIAVQFAHCSFTEITCHGKGAQFLLPGVRLVIDIGGQDSKAIAIENGNVASFQMNDKCAAGTGRFLEMTTARLGIPMDRLDQYLQGDESCSINSMCAVFAESEIITLLAQGHSREAIARGVMDAISKKVCTLAAKIPIQAPVLLTGGLSHVQYLKTALSKELELSIGASSLSPFAGAIGAALLGEKKFLA